VAGGWPGPVRRFTIRAPVSGKQTPLKALILFDIDGTLLNAGGVGRAASRVATEAVFGTAGRIDTVPFGGRTDWAILADALREEGYTRADVGERLPAYSAAIATAMQAMIGAYDVRALPGAQALVARLAAQSDVVLGLVTGNAASTAPIKLRVAGFDPTLFTVGAFGDESPDRAEITRRAWERAGQALGAPVPQECTVVVGDTPADVRAARAIGAVAVAVLTGFATESAVRASEPDVVLATLEAWESSPASPCMEARGAADR
jgi:phosphoglycolate phosphatase